MIYYYQIVYVEDTLLNVAKRLLGGISLAIAGSVGGVMFCILGKIRFELPVGKQV